MTDRLAALPAAARPRIAAYLALLDRHCAGCVEGVYLVGSIALGDFQEGRSDIDLVATVDGPPDAAALDRLAAVHDALAGSPGPAVDGFYIEAGRLRHAPAPEGRLPFSLDGAFHRDDPCFEVNPATWLCLAQHGMALRGPAVATLGIATDPAALRAFLTANLAGYWGGWVEACGRALAEKAADGTVSAGTLAWGVLGTLRIACTLATGRIVSKAGAGDWALRTCPPAWRPVIEDALSARHGRSAALPADRGRQALDLMRQVIAGAGAQA